MVEAQIDLISFLELNRLVFAIVSALVVSGGEVHGQLSLLAQFFSQGRYILESGLVAGYCVKRPGEPHSKELFVRGRSNRV